MYTRRNLEDFMSLLPLQEMRELQQEKQGFVQLLNIYNEPHFSYPTSMPVEALFGINWTWELVQKNEVGGICNICKALYLDGFVGGEDFC